MRLYFEEEQTPDVTLGLKVSETLHTETTPYQELSVIVTERFGRMLVLDGMIMTTERDEFVYHEMITHIPLFTHPNPRNVGIVGGGDGGAVREVLKHSEVEKVSLIEIDERVVKASQKYLPGISRGLNDPRVDIRIEDGVKHIKENKNRYDVIIVDSTDPVGPGVGLFSEDFYASIYEALTDKGIVVAQTESPFYTKELLQNCHKRLKKVFPIVRTYLAFIPTYPGGLWSFTLGSKQVDPLSIDTDRLPDLGYKYFTKELFKSAFVLPAFVQELFK
jgi:spermidine synthase